MEAVEIVFCDLVQRFRLWLPRRVETQVMSRDFWMPDQSCRVCYECDTPFSLFNRRHHCRICGRVFCGKCTQNTLPIVDGQLGICQESERVRACNFCFKLKQEERKRDNDQNVVKPTTPSSLTPSSSSFSLASSGTSSSGSSTSTSSSSGNSGQIPMAYGYKVSTADRIDPIAERNQRRPVRTGRKSHRSRSPKGRDSSPNPYDFCSNRSDDDETDDPQDGLYQTKRIFDVQSQEEEEDDDMELAQAVPNHTPNDLTGNSASYMNKVTSTDDELRCEEANLKIENTPDIERSFSRRSLMSSDEYEGPEESVDESNFYTPSLVQEPTPTVGEELVDVENNESIWVPPPPEDEDAMSMVDEDDEEDDESGWGSFSSTDYRIREKATASQEQRRAMRAVVERHFRALVGQLLDGEELDADSWLEIVTSLASQAASLLKPDTSKDGGMDPGGYVKVKCIAAGQRSDSCVVKGVVCKKNVAHRRMISRYKNPRLLLLGGALEYQRVSNQLSSLDTLLHQELEHLSMTASRIEAHHPNVVLVEKTVSRQAQERLLSKDISLVLNVKRPLLERIARCTGAEIVPAPDQIIKARPGYCDLFRVEKFVEELGSAGHPGKKLTKTLMFFDGCPRPLGFTVLLKGAHGDELKKVKRVLQFAVFAAYQLALETSFLVDEGATLPEHSFKSPISIALPDKPSKLDRSISTVPGFVLGDPGHTTAVGGSESQQNLTMNTFTNLLPLSMNTQSWSDVHTKVPSSAAAAPWSVTSSCFSSRNNSPNVSPRATDTHESSSRTFGGLQARNYKLSLILPNTKGPSDPKIKASGSAYGAMSSNSQSTIYNASIGFQSLTSLHGHGLKISNASSNVPECAVAEGSAVLTRMPKVDSESGISHGSDLTASMEAQSGSLWEDQEAIHEEFPPSPSDHQSILVSFSSSCLRKGTVCERGHLFRIKYYGSFDRPLGKFLKDNVFDLNNVCGFCEEPRDAHIHCYMHRQGSLTISVHHQNEVLSGENEGKIWMWHRCLKCPRVNNVPPATHRVLMSDAAWGLSFGKFLELSFSNHAAASRVAACGHSLHRDCLRFYGFGSMVACFRYAPINVHSVYLPPSKLEFNNPELDEWLLNEIEEVRVKGKYIFAKTFNTLREIEEKVANSGIWKAPEARRRIAEYEASLINDQKAFLETLQKAAPMKRQPGYLFADILELNSTRRSLAALFLVWHQRIQVLQTSLKLNKGVPMSRSANLDDPSILLGIKDKRPIVAHEACDGSLGDVTEWSKLMDAHTGELINQAGGLPHKDPAQIGDPDAGQNFAKQNSEIAPHNHESPILSGQNDLEAEALDSSLKVAEDFNALDVKTLVSADSFLSTKVDENVAKLAEERSGIHSNVLEEEDVLVRRTLSEGQFPVLPDLSDTFEAAWTGKGHTVEAHTVNISSTGQEIASQGSGIGLSAPTDEAANVVAVEASSETGVDPVLKSGAVGSSLYEGVGSGSELVVACPPSSPGKSEKSDDLVWVRTPFSNLYRSYNKGSQYSSNGSSTSDTQWLYGSYASMLPGGEGRIFLPLGIHDAVIPVYDDEPTSIIAYAITSHQYQAHLSEGPSEKDRVRDTEKENEGKREIKDKDLEFLTTESVMFHPLQTVEGSLEHSESFSRDRSNYADDIPHMGSRESGNLQYSKATHVKVSFTDSDPQGRVKYMVTCYYAKQFDALRKTCCSDQMDFIRSLCRCKKWGAQGGKSNVFFAKTKDDRFVIKQVTKTELESFIKFAPEYFKYLSESLKSGSPTCLAKILGIFQVTIKHGKVGKEIRMDLMAMENLLYGRHVTRLYDLKGSLRSRYNADTTKNKVLLDQNLLESMLTNPIFIGNKAKRILERAVWNDTSFLASVDVMDYSLLVGVDEEGRELVLGIIDFMRQYTWDKHLETWVKASGILGGPKNAAPTVISPKQYKKRFRKAMKNYFLMVPDQWSPTAEIFGTPHVDSVESFQSTS